jgi:ABC-type phosphate transport system auxiliary subunit
MVASMPVAKLSREFYDRFGDKVTDELVNCLNSIEASYRAEIKDLFAAHFGRFEEKLERRLAESAAHLGRFEEELEHRLAATKAELRQEIAGLRVEIHSVKADVIKWTFVFWAPVALAVIGLYFKT